MLGKMDTLAGLKGVLYLRREPNKKIWRKKEDQKNYNLILENQNILFTNRL